jgi:hypothetical protein
MLAALVLVLVTAGCFEGERGPAASTQQTTTLVIGPDAPTDVRVAVRTVDGVQATADIRCDGPARLDWMDACVAIALDPGRSAPSRTTGAAKAG